MSLRRSIGDVEYMKKRIPKNAKYQHVKTRLDTGCSLTKYLERLEDIKKSKVCQPGTDFSHGSVGFLFSVCSGTLRDYRYRKDEIFKRLKVTTFAQLVLQVASVSDLNESENDCESHGLEDGDVVSNADLECLSERTNGSLQVSPLSDRQDAGDTRENCYSARSTLLSVISGVGELNLDRNNQKTPNELVSTPEPADTPYPDCPYLLLDVRDRDQYELCHIISAQSFPIAMLSRTMNPYTKEVLGYKNAAGKIIIVYDEDERIASQAATTMCERGFENLFMLSGGLKVVVQKFPEGMTTGSIPRSCLSSPTSSKGKKSSVQQQQQQQQLQAAEKRWRFTSDELAKIQEQLEEIFIPSNSNSRMSSRMSTISSQSGASSARSRQSSSTAGRDSSRVQSSRVWK